MKTTFVQKGLLALALTGMIFVTSCNKDDEIVVDPLLGVYKLTQAQLAAELTMVLTGMETPTTLPVGTSVTTLIGSILAGASPCVNPANAAIELGDGGIFFYTCEGEDVDRIDSGTWSANTSTNVLTMNIKSVALGQTIQVVVSEYLLTGAILTGTVAGFPVPIDANKPLDPTNLQIATVDVSFSKIK